MLDERWDPQVEEVGEALRKLLAEFCSTACVRRAEDSPDGRAPELEHQLTHFGLQELELDVPLLARIAFELGRALAPVPIVEAIPAQVILARRGVSCGFDGPVPAALPMVAVQRDSSLFIEPLHGLARRSSAGDLLVRHTPGGPGERVGDSVLADRLQRLYHLLDAARMIGAGQMLVWMGANYARERRQFGKPIGAFQAVSHRLVNAVTALDGAELLLRKAAFTASSQAQGDGAPSEVFAIMVRAKAVAAARLAAATVHQVYGANGFSQEYDVQLYSRRLRSWSLRGERSLSRLAELARILLDPARRDQVRYLWHHDCGIPRPRWADEADRINRRG